MIRSRGLEQWARPVGWYLELMSFLGARRQFVTRAVRRQLLKERQGLPGTVMCDTKKTLKRHVFLIEATAAVASGWAPKLQGHAAPKLRDALRDLSDEHEGTKVTAAAPANTQAQRLVDTARRGGLGLACVVYPEAQLVSGGSLDALAQAVHSIVVGSSAPGPGAAPQAETLSGAASKQPLVSWSSPLSGSDVLICTHGARDERCGCAGPKLIQQVEDAQASRDTALGCDAEAHQERRCEPEHELRLWGSSHLGGHRFAPIAAVYPAGHWYGHLDQDESLPAMLAQAALQRAGDTDRSPPSCPLGVRWRGRLGMSRNDSKEAAASALEQ